MHQLFETHGSPTPTPLSGMSGVMRGLSLHIHSIFVPCQAGFFFSVEILAREAGVLWNSSDRDDRRMFLGLKFSIPGFVWVGEFG